MIFRRLQLPRRVAEAVLPALLSPLILATSLILLPSCTFDLDYDQYALVYGISDYPGTGNDLSSAHLDAQQMHDLLVDQGFQVTLQIDAAAEKAQLTSDFASIAVPATTIDDLFVFYFSGHGGQDTAGTNGGTENTPNSDSEEEYISLYDDVLTDDELADLLRTIPCARKVVILDACFSGGFISNSLEADAISPNYSEDGSDGLFEILGNAIYLYANFQDYGSDIPPGVAVVIAASGEQDFAYETDGNGVMTRYLIESASEGDLNRDGYVTVSEAYFYIYKNINEHFNMVYGSSGYSFFPHVSGGPVDYILFTK